MTTDEREIKRKLRIISHAENAGNVGRKSVTFIYGHPPIIE